MAISGPNRATGTGFMAKILFLAHRVPFPPNKGDKIRAYHILEHLAARHQIWLGAGADDAADLQHLPMARARYADAYFGAPGRFGVMTKMALGAVQGRPMSVARFRHGGLGRWIDTVLRDVKPDLVYVFSSALAQYVTGRTVPGTAVIVDFVDADAEKWRAFAERTSGPMRLVYAAEFRNLVRYEAATLAAADAGIMVSETERRLQAGFAPADAGKLHVIANGVDTDFFKPPADPRQSQDIVFTGTMDYLPNIDAVTWFAQEIFPRVRAQFPNTPFRIVGAKPSAEVLALADLPGVEVTGAVPDVRPYLFNAAVIVAPLRIARGIQNKVLEGMAAARPTVCTPEALDGIEAKVGRDVLVASKPEDFAQMAIDVLAGRAAGVGPAGRAYVETHLRWQESLVALDRLVDEVLHRRSGQASA
jgi:sugar transferase (PEP-CTERM/EpsH1 system associated)